MTTVGIVGPGRAGVGLGLALARAGYAVRLHGRHAGEVPPPLELSWGGPPPWAGEVDVVVLAVPDDALEDVAATLAGTGQLGEDHTVLHLSGVLDRAALAALRPSGCALGSLHPLQSLSDVESVPERLRGAAAAVEGDAQAVTVAEQLARAVGLEPIRVRPTSKPLYHAAAVFASNYLVVVAATANRLLKQSGVSSEEAWQALLPLIEGTIKNMSQQGPENALTGPVARGDRATVAKHLAALPGDEASLYRALGRAALILAKLGPDERTALEEEFR